MKVFDLTSKFQPTGDQPEAIRQLTEGVLSGTPAQTLLGVTGSGKTIVFLKLIDHVFKLNKQCILMVPEISLTPQMVSFF